MEKDYDERLNRTFIGFALLMSHMRRRARAFAQARGDNPLF